MQISRMRHIVLLATVLLSSGCMLNPPVEDPMQAQLADLERRLAAIERILANGSLVDLTLQVDELERQSADLLGRIDALEHEAAEGSSRQRDLYIDLDERIQKLESGSAASVGVAGGALGPGELPMPGGSDRDNYQAAFEMLKEQRYEQAGMAFRQFLVSFPESQLADNAQYWLAESHYVSGEFQKALGQFKIVVDKFPRSRKVPDALLKMGYCNYELKRWNDARASLQRVQAEFSDTTAARLAEQRLARMTEEGH
ncbi:MAG: tol-pal system protein YbgF [Woeseia sp.]